MFNTVGVFNGSGGLLYGFNNDPEFNIIMACESRRYYIETFVYNFPNIELYTNFRWMKLENIAERTQNQHIDLLIGCPGRDNLLGIYKADDHLGAPDITVWWKKIIELHKPSVIMFESYNSLQRRGKKPVSGYHIENLLTDIGYSVKTISYNYLDFGLPVNRKSHLFVAVYGKYEFPQFEYPHIRLNLRDVLTDLANDGSYLLKPFNEYLEWCRRYPFAGDHKPKIDTRCVKSCWDLDGTVYGLRCSCRVYSNPKNIRPGLPFGIGRFFTPREILRIYGYPDDWKQIGPINYRIDMAIRGSSPWISQYIAAYIKQILHTVI